MLYTIINLLSQILCYVSAFGLSDHYIKNNNNIKKNQKILYYAVMGIVGLMFYHL